MSALLPHRIRRLHWQARAPTPASAFTLRGLLRDATDEVLTALERGLSAHIPADRVLRLPRLTLNVRLPPGAQADDLARGIETAVAEALAGLPATTPQGRPQEDPPSPGSLLDTLQRLPAAVLQRLLDQALAGTGAQDDASLVPVLLPGTPSWHASKHSTSQLPLGLLRQLARQAHEDAPLPASTGTSPAHHAQAGLDSYLGSGNVDWTLAGLDPETLLQVLREAALAWVDGDALPPAMARLPAALRPGAVARWLALLPATRRGDALAARQEACGALRHHPLTPVLRQQALAHSPTTTLQPALWLAWRLEADSAPPALADYCHELRPLLAHLPTADGQALRDALDANAPGHGESAPEPGSTARHTPADTPAPSPTFSQRPESAAPAGLLVPAAGLVLAHPYLSRLLDATGLHPAGTRGPLPDPVLPAATSLLHWLATGREAEQEFSLPFIKLLLGRDPDTPLPHAPPPLPEAWRLEADALLEAMLSHWQALRGTRPAGLRSGFLQRRGCLERSDAAWRLRVEPESFDMLLDLLPWGFSLVRLPWMPRPLVTEWPTP